VEEEERNVVGGFQTTLQSVFEMAAYVLVLLFPTPAQFHILAAVSYLMVVIGALSFTSFAVRHKKMAGGYAEVPT